MNLSIDATAERFPVSKTKTILWVLQTDGLVRIQFVMFPMKVVAFLFCESLEDVRVHHPASRQR
jgi:hypothetical protein